MLPYTTPDARLDPSYVDLISPFMALPRLRAFWPMSSLSAGDNPNEVGGQGRHLSNTGGAVPGVHNQIVPYLDFNGTTQYLTRADEAGLDITAKLTMGGWFWHDATPASGSVMAKWPSSGTVQRSYALYQVSGVITAVVSGDGTAMTTVSGATFPTGRWHFMWMRYDPSTSLDVGIGEAYTRNTTSIPAAIFGSTTDFSVMSNAGGGSGLVDGRASVCFLCAGGLTDQALASLYQRTFRAFL